MRILGVDPGSIVTGYGVIDSGRGQLSIIEQGEVRTRRGEQFPERLRRIYEELTGVIARTSPDAMAVESPFAGLNPKSLIQLAHARGVILLAACNAGLEVFEYSPRSVKSAVVGYGGAEKSQVGSMVQLLVRGARELKMSVDAADALAVAICHAHSVRPAGRIRLQ
ncbi:MAG: crossover junction endodeoxyribonuclease RuvC [Thermoanaerobaculia bacterium]